MDLKTFVTESLTQIAAGIKAAQEAETGAEICPRILDPKTMKIARGASEYIAQSVGFDVAVYVSEGGTGGASVKVAWVELGASIDKGVSNSAMSRIRFDIPIVWPKQEFRT